MVYSPKNRSDVFCFNLNFNISKLGYSRFLLGVVPRARIAKLPVGLARCSQTPLGKLHNVQRFDKLLFFLLLSPSFIFAFIHV